MPMVIVESAVRESSTIPVIYFAKHCFDQMQNTWSKLSATQSDSCCHVGSYLSVFEKQLERV